MSGQGKILISLTKGAFTCQGMILVDIRNQYNMDVEFTPKLKIGVR